jgi:hypothetical protein
MPKKDTFIHKKYKRPNQGQPQSPENKELIRSQGVGLVVQVRELTGPQANKMALSDGRIMSKGDFNRDYIPYKDGLPEKPKPKGATP